MKLDIIVPINNNEDKINSFYESVKESLKNIKYNIIFVDNSSTDSSLNILNKIYKNDDDKIKIISLSKKVSKNELYYIGIKYAKSDTICTFEIDKNISYILNMYKFLKENRDIDCIVNVNTNDNKFRFRKIFINIIKKITNINYIDKASNITIFKKCMLPAIVEMSKKYGFSNAIFEKIGFNIYYDNKYNENVEENNLMKYILYYCNHPLKFIIYFGIGIIFLSLLYLIYLLIFSLKTLNVIIFIIFFTNGINVLLFGLVCNYFTAICKNDNHQNYNIKTMIGFDENYL